MDRERKTRVLHVITRLIRGGADENTVFTVEGVDRDRYDSEILAGCRTEIALRSLRTAVTRARSWASGAMDGDESSADPEDVSAVRQVLIRALTEAMSRTRQGIAEGQLI